MCIDMKAISILTKPMVAYKVVFRHQITNKYTNYSSFLIPERRAPQGGYTRPPGVVITYRIGELATSEYPGMCCYLQYNMDIFPYSDFRNNSYCVIKVLCPEGSTILWSHGGMITTTKLIPVKCVFISWE